MVEYNYIRYRQTYNDLAERQGFAVTDYANLDYETKKVVDSLIYKFEVDIYWLEEDLRHEKSFSHFNEDY